MCMLCSDFVEFCGEGDCKKGTKSTLYFLGDTFCEHLAYRFGTDDTCLYFHINLYHDWETPGTLSTDCEDKCIDNGWYTREQVRTVVDNLRD